MTTKHKEEGVIENIFVALVILLALSGMGSFSMLIIQAQRYQAGLDLAVRSIVRDLVTSDYTQDPQQLARSDLASVFESMGLSPAQTHLSVIDTQGRCGTIQVNATKQLDPIGRDAIVIRLSSQMTERQDPLSSGLPGIATCIGS